MKTMIRLIFFALCFLARIIEANNENVSHETDHNLQIYKDYIEMDKQLMKFIGKNMKTILPYILESSESMNISTNCMDNLFQFMTGLRKLTEWSVSFLDSVGKPQSGMMSGNVHMLGEDHQCFNAVAKKKDKISFRGQYCSVQIKAILPDVNYKFDGLNNLTQHSSGILKMLFANLRVFSNFYSSLGICVPSGCTKEDISQMISYLNQKIQYINATVAFCLKQEDTSYWTNGKIAVVCIFAFLGLLLISSTLYDNIAEKSEKAKLASRILECFSVTRNFSKLVTAKSSEDAITCFYGIRVLTLFWIILCHEYFTTVVGFLANHLRDVEPFAQTFFSQIILNGFASVEVFFFVGGFVNCYTRVKIQKSGKSEPSFLKIIIHRLWRIYPTCIVVYMAYILLASSQPSFFGLQRDIRGSCSNHWWKIFLFINNFFKPFDTCLPHTWYLSADMQIFLLSLITIPVLLRNEKLGMYLHIGVIIIANICCFLLWWMLNLPPSPGSIPSEDVTLRNIEFSIHIYMLPLTHIAPYYTGILLGYVMASKKPKQFSKAIYSLGWLTASFSFITALFITYRWNSGTHHTKLESSLYGSLSTTVNALCISWMVYCCKTNQARLINYILSLKMWIPLSRITFMLFLTSMMVQVYYKTNLNFASDATNINVIWSYLGNLVIALLMSFALVLIAESPLLALEKIVFGKHQDSNKSSFEVKKENTDECKRETVFIENLNNKNSA